MATAAKKLSKLERPPRGGQATLVEAIRQGIWEEMERDPTVFVIGEDVGAYGGAFKVTDGLIDEFGNGRVIDTPISEARDRGRGVRRGTDGNEGGGRVSVYRLHLRRFRSADKLRGEVPLSLGRKHSRQCFVVHAVRACAPVRFIRSMPKRFS